MPTQRKNSTRKKPELENIAPTDSEDFRPSLYMRARRPELYSDSRLIEGASFTREMFEYHLETLTSRKQETEFEHFCRRLAEKEICPNILPQTGPTGGGDSKVDAETYPVADSIALRWYEGVGRNSSSERWAFAFSAKKTWKSKLESDVDKIVQTGRGYKLIYFVTNQFVSDKNRSSAEDSLSQKYKVDVRILDRTWIVKVVFENNRLRLAAETLSISGISQTDQKVTGPNDAERDAELEELEQKINDSTRYQGVEYQLVEDCLEAAILARNLEHPVVEVDGRFQRAERIAKISGLRQQRLRIAYERAWSAYWYYDDFTELNRLYNQAQDLACGSGQADDLKLLSNLWTILHTSVKKKKIDAKSAKLKARTNRLQTELERLAADQMRPNNALHATAILLMMRLTALAGTDESPDAIFAEFKQVIHDSEGLPEFPLESFAKILLEIGSYFSDSQQYDDLFEAILLTTEKRASKGQAGSLLLERGYQMLSARRKYEALRLFGRAQHMLAMQEHQREWISALAGCGLAYESIGLLWAARANFLMAVNQAWSEFGRRRDFMSLTISLVQKVIWLELQIGRPFHVLSWLETANVFTHLFSLNEERKTSLIEERQNQDAVLGLLLLKTDFWELKQLDFLPSVLEKYDLNQSWLFLLYALGHEDYLRSEGIIPQGETTEDVDKMFAQAMQQPAWSDLPAQPELSGGRKVKLSSFVLGCEIVVDAANTPTSVNLAEIILGALESLVSTSLYNILLPYRSDLRIEINETDFISGLPDCKITENDWTQPIVIRHAATIPLNPALRENFRSWLMETILGITLEICIVPDVEAFTEQVIKNELAFERASIAAEVFTAIRNVVGDSPKFEMSEWRPIASGELFSLKRDVAWDHSLKKLVPGKPGLGKSGSDNEQSQTIALGQGTPQERLSGIDNIRHKDFRINSLINLPLWDRAEWKATCYYSPPDEVPFLALGFKDGESAKAIFREWHARLGQIDQSDRLRISIITGIDKSKPASYRIAISSAPLLNEGNYNDYMMFAQRIHRMDPPDLNNLNSFLEQYKHAGKFIILPALFTNETEMPIFFTDLAIRKHTLVCRPAWQIHENDPDIIGLRIEESPIIPSGIKNAPVLRALKRLEKIERVK